MFSPTILCIYTPLNIWLIILNCNWIDYWFLKYITFYQVSGIEVLVCSIVMWYKIKYYQYNSNLSLFLLTIYMSPVQGIQDISVLHCVSFYVLHISDTLFQYIVSIQYCESVDKEIIYNLKKIIFVDRGGGRWCFIIKPWFLPSRFHEMT